VTTENTAALSAPTMATGISEAVFTGKLRITDMPTNKHLFTVAGATGGLVNWWLIWQGDVARFRLGRQFGGVYLESSFLPV